MNVIRHANFSSAFVSARHVDVWLPPSYSAQSTYPVLYMHDGQNVFHKEDANTGVTWGIDEALSKLIAEGAVTPTIVVAIWNGGQGRHAEYLPERPFNTYRHSTPNAPLPVPTAQSDNYLSFLVTELKPFIDQTYATKPEQQATTIMGSSMGGLISLYALCEYPHIFQGAGCLSTHWIILPDPILDYLKTNLPKPGAHKLYFDHGTATLDAHYEPHQQKADHIMQHAGYTQGKDWLTRKFIGAEHNEAAWRQRIHIPLQFLLQNGE